MDAPPTYSRGTSSSLTVNAAAWAMCWVGIGYSATSVAAAFTLAWRNRR